MGQALERTSDSLLTTDIRQAARQAGDSLLTTDMKQASWQAGDNLLERGWRGVIFVALF